MTRGYFVTGTDTGVGKTFISQLLIAALVESGLRVSGMKPVATGCEQTAAGLRSADALALCGASNVSTDYRDANPYAFEPATAPQIAAQDSNVTIQSDTIADAYSRLAAVSDMIVVEGVGGWEVPINPVESMSDIPMLLNLPVILVVPLKLGAINHALLTESAISEKGCRLAAWIANAVGPDSPAGYLESLQAHLTAPLAGVVSHGSTMRQGIDSLDIPVLKR